MCGGGEGKGEERGGKGTIESYIHWDRRVETKRFLDHIVQVGDILTGFMQRCLLYYTNGEWMLHHFTSKYTL